MSWTDGSNLITPLRHDPKRLAREFLRIRGVSYKDLITGDHAADLFFEFNKHIIDWNIQIEKLSQDVLKYSPMVPFCIKKEDMK